MPLPTLKASIPQADQLIQDGRITGLDTSERWNYLLALLKDAGPGTD